jgi:hypothetical protein
MRCSAILPRLFGVLVLAGVPSGLLAQVTPYRIAGGDVVRFHIAEREGRVVGRVASVTPDTLWLESRPTWVRSAFARDEVKQLERRVSGPSGTGMGILFGGGLGVGLGVIWGIGVCSMICEPGDDAGVLLATGGTLGVLGALAGGIIGRVGWPSTWSIGVWPTPAGSGAAIGVRLTFRL